MIFDAMKVTYNTYSCVISGMSREIMEMDGRDRAECQNWEKKNKMVIFGKVKSQKDLIMYSAQLLKFKRSKKREFGRGDAMAKH